MTVQREKPGITPEQLAKTFGKDNADGAIVSGGQIENFREGWALEVMGAHEKAHYYIRDKASIERAKSLCGVVVKVRWLYGAGNFGRCARCDKALKVKKRYG